MDSKGNIMVVRAAVGTSSSINLTNPKQFAGYLIVGYFHTHPNPTSEGWVPYWSPSDISNAYRRNVPGLIMSDKGIYYVGPDRRGAAPSVAGPPGVDGGFPGSGADTRSSCP